MPKRHFHRLHGKNSDYNAVARLCQSDPLHLLKAAAKVDVPQQGFESKGRYTCKAGTGGGEMLFNPELGCPPPGTGYARGKGKHLLGHPPDHLDSHIPANTIYAAIF